MLHEMRMIRWGIRMSNARLRGMYKMPGTAEQKDAFLFNFNIEVDKFEELPSDSEGDIDAEDSEERQRFYRRRAEEKRREEEEDNE